MKSILDVQDKEKKWEKGSTTLSITKEEGHDDIIQLLLEAGAVE